MAGGESVDERSASTGNCRRFSTRVRAAWTTGYGSIDSGSTNLSDYAAAGNMTSVYRYLNEVVKFGVFGAYNYVALQTGNPLQTNRTDDLQFGSYLRADDGVWRSTRGTDGQRLW